MRPPRASGGRQEGVWAETPEPLFPPVPLAQCVSFGHNNWTALLRAALGCVDDNS